MDGETLENLKHLLPLIYIIPSYVLYFFILYVMFLSPAKTKFSGSFYYLFGASAINNLIQSIFYYATLRFPYTPVFFEFTKNCPLTNWLYPTLYICLYYSAMAQHFYSLFISFNRFTVFFLLAKYKMFWLKYLKYFLAFAVLVPILFVWHFPFISVQCFFFPEFGATIFPTNPAAIPWMAESRTMFIQILITSFLSFSLNMHVIVQLLKRQYYGKITTMPSTIISSQDIKMFIYSLLIFFIEICGCLQQALLTFAYATFQALSSTQWILADVGTLAPAFFILATNKQLRKEVLNLLDFGGSRITQNLPLVITIESTNTRQ